MKDDIELLLLRVQYDFAVMVWNSYTNLILFASTDEEREKAIRESDEALEAMNEIENKMMERIRNG